MVFSSSSFLFFFLPLTVAAYFLCTNRKWRNGILMLASLLFYSWGEPKHVIIMIAVTFVAFLGALAIDHFQRSSRCSAAKISLFVTVLLLLTNLVAFKYLNFIAENICKLMGISNIIAPISLPIGISFYTFQILSYVIDLYRGKIAVQNNPLNLLLYVSLFPQLIAGPIVRYETVEHEIIVRSESWNNVIYGLERFLIGLSKKLIIANNAALIATKIYAGEPAVYGTAMYWLAAFAYTLQIYFDFSGYSDMAIGLGRIFGFHFLENFNYPYSALSVTDFWRRWHISLSSWFRDYVYIPLGGNRVSKNRWLFNLGLVWILTGLWHGADWNFVLWGGYYCVILMVEKFFLNKFLEKLPSLFRWLYTFIIVMVGWVIFNLCDMEAMTEALIMMFSIRPTCWFEVLKADLGILTAFIYLPLGFAFAFPLPKLVKKYMAANSLLRLCVSAILVILCLTYTISSTYNPFIYFRF